MIKPPIKINPSKFSICSWILEKFPLGYEQMRYVEPFVGNGSFLLNKLKSEEEVVGDNNLGVIGIWRVLRDENKNFRNKISKLEYTEKYFNLLKNKNEQDKFKQVFIDFVLRKMSKSGQKEIFDLIDKKKANQFWKELAINLSKIEERIKDVYFISKKPVEIIQNFDGPNAFCFCCPPPILADDKSAMTTDDYVNLTDSLKAYRGKVVFCGNNCSFYKRIFSEWKLIKNKNNTKQNDYIWINF
jgi:site-specific DNA-adenine methylase